MRDRDRELAVVISIIAATKELLTMYISFASGESDPVAKADHVAHAKEYEQEILKPKKNLSDIASRKRKRNPIVLKVLDQGGKSLGISAPNEDTAEIK